MRKNIALVVALCVPSAALAQTPAAKPAAAGLSDEQKTFYSLGVWLAGKVDVFQLSPAELKTVEKGLNDAVLHKKLQANVEESGPKINALAQSRAAIAAQKRKATEAAFVAKVLKEPGAKQFPSGLIFTEIKAGTGASPKATDTVSVHYEGKLTDGSVFDSSIARGKPAEFPLNGVIPCWTEGVQMLKVGGKARLICPSAIAYGDQGRPPQIPGGATLDFTVELLSISAPAAPAAAAVAPKAAPKKKR